MKHPALLTKYAFLLLIATVSTSPIQCASSRFKLYAAAVAVSTGIAVPAVVLPQMLPGILRYREELKRRADVERAIEIVEHSLDKQQKCSIIFQTYTPFDVQDGMMFRRAHWRPHKVTVPDDMKGRHHYLYETPIKGVRVCDSNSQCIDLESIRHANHLLQLLGKVYHTVERETERRRLE